ncbi:MAG TPA: 5'-3' exonuclease H3TH domain-containing protein [Thermoanaerobaculia bacterium]|nr:5'-3' exonuclease H3TH domain-containing protein [Thermoanaerobaculia bacterium]
MTTTVHLIDASPYLFRAFFSLPKSIVDANGKPANAVYGFAQFIAKYVADTRPTHIAVAFDRHFNGSFRNDFYPPYKAHREASPPELDAQVDPALAAVESAGIATFIHETHEADDLIATILEQTWPKGAHYVIVSSDKDLTQLVCDRVTLVDPARGLRFDAAAVLEKFGVRPDQITDFLGLAGDAVDNIPGVRGVGPKTAADLLRRYGSIEGIYEQVPAMRLTRERGLADKLAKDVEMAGLSKRLATVARDAPIGKVTIDALRLRA